MGFLTDNSTQSGAIKIHQKLKDKVSYEYDKDHKIVLFICDDKSQQINTREFDPLDDRFVLSKLKIIFFTHYIDDPLKKMELSQFTSYRQIPIPEKNGNIVINGLLWRIVSVTKLHESPKYLETLKKIILNNELVIEVLVKKTIT